MSRKRSDITGMRFGRLLVLEYVYSKDNATYWKCLCDCGNEHVTKLNSLKRGATSSCGCLLRELATELGLKAKKELGYGSFVEVYNNYRGGARRRNLDFTLDKQQFRIITSSDCFYCGRKPSSLLHSGRFNGDYIYNGVDRVDNSFGYVWENCVPCCEACNRAKRMMTFDEFINWIAAIYSNINVKRFSGAFNLTEEIEKSKNATTSVIKESTSTRRKGV